MTLITNIAFPMFRGRTVAQTAVSGGENYHLIAEYISMSADGPPPRDAPNKPRPGIVK